MDRARRLNVHAAVTALSLFASVYAQVNFTPGQPSTSNAPLGQFKIVGDSIVSAQQVRGLASRFPGLFADARFGPTSSSSAR